MNSIVKRLLTILMVVLMLSGVPTVNVNAAVRLDNESETDDTTPVAENDGGEVVNDGDQNPVTDEGDDEAVENDDSAPQTQLLGKPHPHPKEEYTFTVYYDPNDGSEGHTVQDTIDKTSKTFEVEEPVYHDDGEFNYWLEIDQATGEPTGNSYEPGDQLILKVPFGGKEASVYLRADWSVEYELTYSLNYFDEEGKVKEYTTVSQYDGSFVESEFDVLDDIPLRDGFEFLGWYYDKNGNEAVGDTVTVSADTNRMLTIYAKWKQAKKYKYELEFKKNCKDTVAGMPSEIKEYGSEKNHHIFDISNLAAPSREGYTFVGWAYDKNGTRPVVDNQVEVFKDEVDLYAQWAKGTVYKYTLTYSLNYMDETGDVPVFYVAQQSSVDTETEEFGIIEGIPVRDGFDFVGWYYDNTGNEPVGDTVEVTAGTNRMLTIYAKWAEKVEYKYSYLLTLDARGGQFDEGKDTLDYSASSEDRSHTFKLTSEPVREGFLFKGWAENKWSDKVVYETDDEVELKIHHHSTKAEKTLYAVWAKEYEYNLIYSYNYYDEEGSVPTFITDTRYSTDADELEFDLDTTVPEREGYDFLGWFYDETCNVPVEDPVTVTSDTNRTLTIFAKWEKQASEYTYSIYYDVYPGEEYVAEHEPSSEDRYTFTVSGDFEREGFKLEYFTEKDTGKRYYPGQKLTLKANGADYGSEIFTILEAKWKKVDPIKYTLILYGNGGVFDDESVKYYAFGQAYDRTYTFEADELPVPEKEGYDFLGWAKSKRAITPDYTDGITLTSHDGKAVSKEVYAVWKKAEVISYTLTLNANGGLFYDEYEDWTLRAPDTNAYHTFDLTEEPEPTREGYTLLGWSLDPEAEEATYTTEFTLAKLEDENRKGGEKTVEGTIYAVWEKEKETGKYGFCLTLDANGGSFEYETVVRLNGRSDEKTYTFTDLPEPEREGYTFKGWSLTKLFPIVRYTDTVTLKVVWPSLFAKETLHAVWAEEEPVVNQAELIFYPNGGELPHGEERRVFFVTGPRKQLRFDGFPEDGLPEREGYTLAGWADSPEGEVILEPTGVVDFIFEDTTYIEAEYYAIWEKAEEYTLTVKYEVIGGTFEDGTTEREYVFTDYDPHFKYTLISDIPVYEDGNRFIYWLDLAHADYLFDPEEEVEFDVPEGETELTVYYYGGFAKGYDYTLYYKLNPEDEGYWEPDYKFSVEETSYTFTVKDAPTIVPEGYEFDGWLDETTGEVYYPGDDYVLNAPEGERAWYAEATLVARWAKVYEFKLEFDFNGGEDGPDTLIETDRSPLKHTFIIPETTPTREGYRFRGWLNPIPSDLLFIYEPGDEITITTPDRQRKLQAVWAKEFTYTLNYFGNAGEEEVENLPETQVEIDENPISHKFTVSEQIPTREGYGFIGWSTKPNSERVDYLPGEETNPVAFVPGCLNLYAVWAKVYDFTLHFDLQGGKSDVITDITEQSYFEDLCVFELPEAVPTKKVGRTTYRFYGWSTDPEATEGEYKPGDLYSTTETDSTLYAIWTTEYIYTLNFDPNGGEFYVDSMTELDSHLYHTFTLPEEAPVREGYDFAGWLGTARVIVEFPWIYKPGESVTLYADKAEQTLTAQWVKNFHYSIRYIDLIGDYNSYEEITTHYPVHVFHIPDEVPETEGWQFEGWLGTDLKMHNPGEDIYLFAIDFDVDAETMVKVAKILASTDLSNPSSFDLAKLRELGIEWDDISFTDGASTTLTAVWRKMIKATYNVDNELRGKVSVDEEWSAIGDDFEGSTAEPNPGYDFDKWTRKVLGFDVFYTDDETCIPDKPGTYTAHFKPRNDTKYYVDYYYMQEDGTYPEEPDRSAEREGTTEKLVNTTTEDHKPGVEGYRYDLTSDLNYEMGPVSGDPENPLRLRVYFKRMFKVTYQDGLDGKVFPTQVTGDINYGDPTPVFKGSTDRAHYKFVGWKRASDGVIVIDPRATDIVTKNETYTAVYEGEKVTVTYKLDGGNYGGDTSDVVDEYTFDDDLKFKARTAPVRDGYEFQYWKTSGLFGKKYYPGTEYDLDNDLVLTAVWKKKGRGPSGGGSSDTIKKLIGSLIPKTGVKSKTNLIDNSTIESNIHFLSVDFPVLIYSLVTGSSVMPIYNKIEMNRDINERG